MEKHLFYLCNKKLNVELNIFKFKSSNLSYYRPILRYKITHDNVTFSGNDFSPSHKLWKNSEGREAALELLNFISVRPGDVDEEFFKDYTKEQLEWVEKYGESLSLKLFDIEEANKKRNKE